VTNQLVLLELPAELQSMLSAGSLAERDGRLLARHLKDNPGLDAAALLDHLEQTKTAAAMLKQQEKEALALVRGAQPENAAGTLLSADNNGTKSESDPAQTGQQPSSLSADNKPSDGSDTTDATGASVQKLQKLDGGKKTAEPSSALPGQRNDPAGDAAGTEEEQEDSQPKRLPYDDPVYVAMHLERKMEPADFLESTRLMATKCWDRAGLDPSLNLLRDMLREAEQHDPESLQSLLAEFTSDAMTA
jgi:ParB family chromosome partitioning protein